MFRKNLRTVATVASISGNYNTFFNAGRSGIMGAFFGISASAVINDSLSLRTSIETGLGKLLGYLVPLAAGKVVQAYLGGTPQQSLFIASNLIATACLAIDLYLPRQEAEHRPNGNIQHP